MYKNINDYEQLYLIRENDEEAKETVFRKYKPIIVSIANKYYENLKDKCELQDLIQEGYIGLSRAIDSYSDNCNALFYTFACICISRQILSYFKKNLSEKNKFFYGSYSLDNELDAVKYIDVVADKDSNNVPDIYIDNNFYNELLINFKNSLDLKNSTVFELRYNGFKYKEISKLLGISMGTVDNCVHYCKEKLKLYLENSY